MRTHRIASHIHLLAQFSLCRVGHEGRVAGEIQCEYPSLQSLLLGCQGCCFAGCLRESVELCLVGDVQLEGLILLQQVLRELQGEHGSLLRQLAQPGLSCFVEQGTRAHKPLVAVVEEHLLLWRQLTMMQVYLADALKELGVQSYVVGVLCQDGLHLLCQRIHLVIGLCTQQVEEYRADT